VVQDLHGLDRIALGRGRVDEVQQQPAALDVAQEAQAEARPGVGALDQAGNVRDTNER
jgi:hypothetical protein